jgi:RNA polymerase sigma-70 factor, ECF subfamily
MTAIAMRPPFALTEDPEQAFIDQLLAGDERAFRELYRRHSGEVHRVAARLVGSAAEADEVMQQVFLTVFRRLSRFEGRSSLRTWLYRVTVNTALKRLRWRRRRREVGGDAVLERRSAGPDPEERVAANEALQLTLRCLEQLDARKRVVLVLHEVEGLDTAEIADLLGCPRSTVLTRLARARAEVRWRASCRGVAA